MVQPAAIPKFCPVNVTTVPTLTLLLGVKVIVGTTVNVAVALSPKFPVSVIVTEPAGLLSVFTTNEPVATPPETEHGARPAIVAPEEVIEQLPSPVLNPEPEIVIVWPPVPLLGEGVIAGLVTVNPAETVP